MEHITNESRGINDKSQWMSSPSRPAENWEQYPAWWEYTHTHTYAHIHTDRDTQTYMDTAQAHRELQTCTLSLWTPLPFISFTSIQVQAVWKNIIVIIWAIITKLFSTLNPEKVHKMYRMVHQNHKQRTFFLHLVLSSHVWVVQILSHVSLRFLLPTQYHRGKYVRQSTEIMYWKMQKNIS